MTYDLCYEQDAIFQCTECGRSFRRDRCRTRKGSIECPRCLPSGICGTLRYTHRRESDARALLSKIDGSAEPWRLMSGERFMLDWLSKEESSALGECEGADLAHLEQMGLVEIIPAEGKHRHYSSVRLTNDGRAALSKIDGGGNG